MRGPWAWPVPHHDHEAAHGLGIRELRADVPRQPTEGLRAASRGARSPSESDSVDIRDGE